jgi:hypothetical protein
LSDVNGTISGNASAAAPSTSSSAVGGIRLLERVGLTLSTKSTMRVVPQEEAPRYNGRDVA